MRARATGGEVWRPGLPGRFPAPEGPKHKARGCSRAAARAPGGRPPNSPALKGRNPHSSVRPGDFAPSGRGRWGAADLGLAPLRGYSPRLYSSAPPGPRTAGACPTTDLMQRSGSAPGGGGGGELCAHDLLIVGFERMESPANAGGGHGGVPDPSRALAFTSWNPNNYGIRR